jgi:hypothetical protein
MGLTAQSPDADEPGSTTYNQQAWKHIRNEQLVETSRHNEEHACMCISALLEVGSALTC